MSNKPKVIQVASPENLKEEKIIAIFLHHQEENGVQATLFKKTLEKEGYNVKTISVLAELKKIQKEMKE